MVTVTSGDGFDPKTGQPRQPNDVSKEVGIQRRNDVTIENVKKLILRAIKNTETIATAPLNKRAPPIE